MSARYSPGGEKSEEVSCGGFEHQLASDDPYDVSGVSKFIRVVRRVAMVGRRVMARVCGKCLRQIPKKVKRQRRLLGVLTSSSPRQNMNGWRRWTSRTNFILPCSARSKRHTRLRLWWARGATYNLGAAFPTEGICRINGTLANDTCNQSLRCWRRYRLISNTRRHGRFGGAREHHASSSKMRLIEAVGG